MDRPLPPHLSPPVRAALTEAMAVVRDLYGPRLQHLVLFGSHARGDAHEASDVDVLVVLGGEVDYMAEVRRLLALKLDLLDRYDLLVSFIPVAQSTYQNAGHPLMINVYEEGTVLA